MTIIIICTTFWENSYSPIFKIFVGSIFFSALWPNFCQQVHDKQLTLMYKTHNQSKFMLYISKCLLYGYFLYGRCSFIVRFWSEISLGHCAAKTFCAYQESLSYRCFIHRFDSKTGCWTVILLGNTDINIFDHFKMVAVTVDLIWSISLQLVAELSNTNTWYSWESTFTRGELFSGHR